MFVPSSLKSQLNNRAQFTVYNLRNAYVFGNSVRTIDSKHTNSLQVYGTVTEDIMLNAKVRRVYYHSPTALAHIKAQSDKVLYIKSGAYDGLTAELAGKFVVNIRENNPSRILMESVPGTLRFLEVTFNNRMRRGIVQKIKVTGITGRSGGSIEWPIDASL